MAEMDGTHPQTPIPRFLSSLALEDNRLSQVKGNSKRKLEDYLDPLLLHTISSRIGRTETKEKQQMERKVIFADTNQRAEFDWPIDRLDPLIKDPNRDIARGSGVEDDGGRFFSPTRPSFSVVQQTPSKRFADVEGER